MFVLFLLVLAASIHNSTGRLSEEEFACLKTGQIYSQKDSSCHFAATQGPCRAGEWFVLIRSCEGGECGGFGVCKERDCLHEKMVEVEGKCRWLSERRLCPGRGEKLWTNMYGKGECACEEGFYRHQDGRCYQEFTKGWCSDGQVLLNLRHLNETEECRTVNSTEDVKFNSDAACVFPFRYKGRTYDGCTAVDATDGVPWCSTKVDDLGGHVSRAGQWGPCSRDCPASGFPTLTLDGIVDGREVNALFAVDLVKVKNREKLVCRENPCGNPELKLMWYDGECHEIWESLDNCVVQLREKEGGEEGYEEEYDDEEEEVVDPSEGKLLCEFEEIELFSISTNEGRRKKCKSGEVWSKRMKKCAKNPFVG